MASHEHSEPMRRRLHVLHVLTPTTGGVAAVTLSYIRDQVDRGWNVTVACPSEGTLGYDAREAGARVRWWRARPEPGLHTLGEMSRLSRIIEETRPDVVHLHGGAAGLVGRLAVRDKIPTVFQPHGWSFQSTGDARRRTAVRWERYAVRWVGELVCVSEGERRVGEARGVVAPTTVLPNGVDVSRLRPQGDRERVQARQQLELSTVPTAVCIGRISEQKGQRDLVAAWPAVRSRVPEAVLLLVGEGAERHGFAKNVAEVEGVRFVGARTDISSWLAAADVVVSPSLWEGMSLVPLEAMASARSVVTTDATGFADSVPDDAGAIVPAGDQAALVEAIVRRLESPQLAEDEGWNGRSHVEFHHDATTSARELSRVYLRLVAARRGR